MDLHILWLSEHNANMFTSVSVDRLRFGVRTRRHISSKIASDNGRVHTCGDVLRCGRVHKCVSADEHCHDVFGVQTGPVTSRRFHRSPLVSSQVLK